LAPLLLSTAACGGFSPPAPHPESDAGDAGLSTDVADAEVDAANDAPSDASPTGIDAAPTCNPAVDPTTAPCLVAGGGLFVSPTGSDANDGSPDHPFATVGHALHVANPTGRLYICGGSYSERIALQAGATANLYGGFACPVSTTLASDAGPTSFDASSDASLVADASSGQPWGPGGAATVFEPPTYDPLNNWVLSVVGVTSTAHIQGMQFVAPSPSGTDASHNGNSSFAAIVIGSTLELVDVTLSAGRGVDGAAGTSGDTSPNYTGPKAADGVSPYVDLASVNHIGIGGVQNACVYAHDSRGLPQTWTHRLAATAATPQLPSLPRRAAPIPCPPCPRGPRTRPRTARRAPTTAPLPTATSARTVSLALPALRRPRSAYSPRRPRQRRGRQPQALPD
jgi:hypothetical protein